MVIEKDLDATVEVRGGRKQVLALLMDVVEVQKVCWPFKRASRGPQVHSSGSSTSSGSHWWALKVDEEV